MWKKSNLLGLNDFLMRFPSLRYQVINERGDVIAQGYADDAFRYGFQCDNYFVKKTKSKYGVTLFYVDTTRVIKDGE